MFLGTLNRASWNTVQKFHVFMSSQRLPLYSARVGLHTKCYGKFSGKCYAKCYGKCYGMMRKTFAFPTLASFLVLTYDSSLRFRSRAAALLSRTFRKSAFMLYSAKKQSSVHFANPSKNLKNTNIKVRLTP